MYILQGYQIEGYLNGQYLFETDIFLVPVTGFVGFGTSDYGYAEYDNLQIYHSELKRDEEKLQTDTDTLYFVPKY